MKTSARAFWGAEMRKVAIALCGVWLVSAATAQDAHEEADQLTVETAPVQVELDLSCRFDRECFEDEACSDSAYEAELTGIAGGFSEDAMVAQAIWSSVTGDVELYGLRHNGAMALAGGGYEARQMVTLSPEGAARLTVHYAEGPMMVSYIGRCAEVSP